MILVKTKMANLNERLTNSQVGYSHESAASSFAGSLNTTYSEDSATTKIPVHPESEQTSKLLSIIFILLFPYFDCSI